MRGPGPSTLNSQPSTPILRPILLAGAALVLAACAPTAPHGWQGYFEGEYVYVASPLAGRLDHLQVARGDRVAAGAPLFRLDDTAETANQREAAGRLDQADSTLEDLRKGQRPTELEALAARLGQARTTADLSARELERATHLHDTHVLADDDFDRTRLTHEANLKQVSELEADLATAKLGARSDAVAAGEAQVASAKAAVERADWDVAQKAQAAPRAGLVYDTLYREGEFVPAGTPVISLLPPENIKIRFFVPEAEFGSLKAGDVVKISFTNAPAPIDARITYLSPQPEYTPPILYNRENRSKLVFMVEAWPVNPAAARDFHPGQPVDVSR
ncbi:MAG TPA: HlyD family efflux transporter periplasmic adaptor subunit [Candidatus Didemnitutus sp.]|nr:HlyD family efflux transporter periplasmic adaptor subunit [Candidatus Didemnitutus sp.]